jgi:hypothetical protein
VGIAAATPCRFLRDIACLILFTSLGAKALAILMLEPGVVVSQPTSNVSAIARTETTITRALRRMMLELTLC